MSNQYLSFDVTKQSTPQQLITGRQGDSQLKFVTMLFWDGDKNVPYDLTGKQVAFEALKPDNTHVVDYEGITILDAPAGLVRYSFNEQVFSVAGTMQQAFFKITHTDGDNNVLADSTLEVAINILENRVEFGINSKDYLSEYDDLIAQVKKKFDDYAATVQDSIAKAQALHDKIVEYTNLINSNGVITKNDFGEISKIKQPMGTNAVDKLNNEFSDRGINVKWFGAKGDGVSDDSDAIISAIAYAKDNNVKKVIVPAGEYLICSHIDIPDKVHLVGEGMYSSIFQPSNIDYLFSLGSYCKLSKLQINNKKSGVDVRDISLSGNNNTLWSTVSDIVIMNGYDGCETTGIYISPTGTSENDLRTIYPNTFKDIYIYGLSNGLIIDNKNYNFINSNVFENIHIRRFSKVGLTITSTGDNGYGVFGNVFSNIEIQAESPVSGPESRHMIMTTGRHNKFNNLVTWSDNHLLNPTLTLQLDDYHKDTSTLSDNYFDGVFETKIDTTSELAKMNFLEDVEINAWFDKSFNGSVIPMKGHISGDNNNVLPKGLIANEVNNYISGFTELLNIIPNGGSGKRDFSFGIDDISPYIEIKENCSLFIPINGLASLYVKQSPLFTVVADFDTMYSDISKSTIFPSFGHYNSSDGSKKPYNKTLKQGGRVGVNTYRMANTVSPLEDIDLSSYNGFFASFTALSGGSVRLRNIYIVPGNYNINCEIQETREPTIFSNVISNANPSSLADIGLFYPNQGDTLFDNFHKFNKNLINVKDIGDGKYQVSYPMKV